MLDFSGVQALHNYAQPLAGCFWMQLSNQMVRPLEELVLVKGTLLSNYSKKATGTMFTNKFYYPLSAPRQWAHSPIIIKLTSFEKKIIPSNLFEISKKAFLSKINNFRIAHCCIQISRHLE